MKSRINNFHFGSFRLDSSSVLSRSGEHLSIPPKELELLKLLLQHADSIVTHEQIEQEIWPRQTVSYASVARCMYSLRKILGDTTREYIVTIPKRGYRIGVPVRTTTSVLGGAVVEKIARAKPLAYSCFVEGVRMANADSFESMQRAVKLFEKACEIDPDFAVAHAAIADCRMYQGGRGYILPAESMRLALASCERALAIDDQLASAHAVRGWFECVAGDMDAGFASLKTALELDPEYARAYSYLSFSQRIIGLVEESIASARRAIELDPFSLLHRHAQAWRLFTSGRPEEALEVERSNVVEYPNQCLAHGAFAMIAAWLGDYEASLDAIERMQEMACEDIGVMTMCTYALARAGDAKQARSMADELLTRSVPRSVRSHIAMIYVQLGDFEQALGLLQEARREKCPWFRAARFDPRIEGLADDPRLQALYKDIPGLASGM